MQEKIRNKFNSLSEKWKELDKGLRIKIIVLSVLILIALGITVYLTTKPKWVVLESNSDISTIGKIENIFDDNDIKSKITKNGSSIQVMQKDLNKAKILLAEENISKSGFTFDDAFETSSIGMSESDKREMYLVASETSLEDQIKTIDGIDSANVKLVIPQETVLFENNKTEASASITVVTNREFSKDEATTIARLVCMSVEGLDMKNIEIVDQNANSLYSGSSNDLTSYSSKEDIENQKKKDVEMQIRAALAKLYDDVNIITNLKIDWNKSQTKTVTYTPPIDDMTVGVPSKTSREEENVVNGTEGAEPGVEANDEYDANYAMENETGATYDGTKEDNDYLYNTEENVTDIAEGAIVYDASSISVVVYNWREYNEGTLRENGTLNDDMSWDDFKEQNNAETRLEIDPDLIESLRVGTGIENISVVGYEKPMFVDEVTEPLAIEQIIILVILALLLLLLAFALIRKTRPEEIEEVEPELSVEDLIATTEVEEENENQDQNLASIDKIDSEYLVQINKFVDEKPEAVAQLLRNWLNDEWE